MGVQGSCMEAARGGPLLTPHLSDRLRRRQSRARRDGVAPERIEQLRGGEPHRLRRLGGGVAASTMPSQGGRARMAGGLGLGIVR